VRTIPRPRPKSRWPTSTDYLAAGTQVVWDVHPVAECIHVYRASDPTRPNTYRKGDISEAEPAVPRWRVAVDWIFG
jgi:Uma2 family endonuclease